MSRFLAAGVVAAMLFTGCAAQDERVGTEAADSAPATDAAGGLLAAYGLDGMEPRAIIDHLDRLGGEDRPAELMASVRPDALVLSAGGPEQTLDLPEDRFYLSVAPYVGQTHECHYHSLTTCQGELTAQEVDIEVVADDGTVLVDDTRATFDNGFVGLWLPRDIRATLRITSGDRSGETRISTDADAPTCLTSLRLA